MLLPDSFYLCAMKRTLLSILVILQFLLSFSRNDSLRAQAQRISTRPKIDGQLDEQVWKEAIPLSGFIQSDPRQGTQASFQTMVYILYDDEAIYFGAEMFDNSPDSILLQLGDRDHDLNADDIVFQFDPFNNNQDAYYFRVTASNVQSEWRKRDGSFNAVWHSKTIITSQGWTAEVKIPFSSLRMPPVEQHVWAFQATRNIRRYREFSKWAPETKGVDNEMIFWGTLYGISQIKPPVRLSLTPYLSVFSEFHNNTVQTETFRITPIGGIDLKYGINESFTLDLTLLPDFSQVKSDDVVKNLSAFEVNFSEQRLFFLESMDLFKLGGLFYSRRIGRFPSGYYSALESVAEDEEMISNPASVSLINSFKITGQTSKGLSVGVLNAITNRTFAEIRKQDGSVRQIETEPLSNYNILVLRQALINNSWVYIINTNALRNGAATDANVTGAGLKLYDTSNRYALTFNGAASSRYQQFNDIALNEMGYSWNLMTAKVRGNFQFHAYHQRKNDQFNINDLGINYTNDESHSEIQVSYKIFDPFWKLLRLNTNAYLWRSNRISTQKPTNQGVSFNASTTTVKHLSIWGSSGWYFSERYDYYEPRTQGYYYIIPPLTTFYLGFSSDYRKTFALDGSLYTAFCKKNGNRDYSFSLNPIIRVSNHFQFELNGVASMYLSSFGYAGRDSISRPVFGKRDVTTIENSFTGKYMFRNNLSLSLRFRYYWSKGEYIEFFRLHESGRLLSEEGTPKFDNFNFNSFLIDLVFNWEFAPGSNLTLVWKNSIIDEQNYVIHDYWENLSNTFDKPQTNLLSLKFIYYLDYNSVFRKVRKQ